MIIAGAEVHDFPAKITFYVVMVAMLAACGGNCQFKPSKES